MNERRGAISYIIATLILIGFLSSTVAQNISIPDAELNAAIREALQKPNGPLTEQDLLSLTNLNACCRNIASAEGLETALNLTSLVLDRNQLTSFSLPSGLTKLVLLDLSFNSLTNVSLPGGLTNLTTLVLEGNLLTNVNLPAGLTGLKKLDLDNNQLTSFTLTSDLTGLISLDLGENQLTSFTVPAGLTNLAVLTLFFNQLTNLSLAAGLGSLTLLDLGNNQLTNLTLPAGLTNLVVLVLQSNALTSLTLPPDMQALTELLAVGDPLAILLLSEPMAATNLADSVAALRNQNVSVFTYPLGIRLIAPQRTAAGGFQFALTGPPGLYHILASTDLARWTELEFVTNMLGTVRFTDASANSSPQKFYQVRSP